MRITTVFVLCFTLWALAGGCAEKATQEQIDKACENLADLNGVLKGSSEKEEGARIEKEYAGKMQMNRDQLAKEIKGLDDVLAVQLAAIDEEPEPTPAPDNQEAAAAEPAEGEAVPLTKEEKKKALVESFDKKKEELRGPFDHEMELFKPYLAREKKEAMDLAREKHAKKVKIIADCQEKSEGLTAEAALCRIEAQAEDWFWNNCK